MAKKLTRSQEGRMIGGVCAGLAEYFDVDVSLVRLIFVAITLITALVPMLIFYVIAWVVIPAKKAE